MLLDPDSPRLQPTWRKPVGIIAMLIGLAVYAGLVVQLSAPIGRWPVLLQSLAYVVLGTIWLLPLRRFMIWMETGRWG